MSLGGFSYGINVNNSIVLNDSTKIKTKMDTVIQIRFQKTSSSTFVLNLGESSQVNRPSKF